MAELMNRVRLSNSYSFTQQEQGEKSKFQEIGNRMCSSIGGLPKPSSAPAPPPARRPYVPRQQPSNPSKK
uniref:Ovule protein n=1 Tax=Caenorhabditis tropicalis TaxID=1561998 RepID=A0A1I7V0R9_9PELO